MSAIVSPINGSPVTGKINCNLFEIKAFHAQPSQSPQPMVNFLWFRNSPGLALSGVPNHPRFIRGSILTFQSNISWISTT